MNRFLLQPRTLESADKSPSLKWELKSLCQDSTPKTEQPRIDDNLKDNGNRIVDWASLKEGIENNLCCCKCIQQKTDNMLDKFDEFIDETTEQLTGREMVRRFKRRHGLTYALKPHLTISEETVGIATTIKCSCSGNHNLFQTHREEVFWKEKPRKKSNENFSLNLLLVMALQQMGGSGTEADTLLTFLALLHDSSFKSTKFHRLDDKIGYNICNLAEKEIENSLHKDVKLHLVIEGRDKDFDKWKAGEKFHQ